MYHLISLLPQKSVFKRKALFIFILFFHFLANNTFYIFNESFSEGLANSCLKLFSHNVSVTKMEIKKNNS